MPVYDITATVVLSSLWALAAAGIAWYCSSVAQHITYVTLADGRRRERRLPLIFRLFLPLAPDVAPLFRQAAFRRVREKADERITAAGFEGLISSVEFLSLHVILPLAMLVPWVGFCHVAVVAAGGSVLEQVQGALFVFGPLWFTFYPSMWLRRELARRHRNILRALPYVLDLLTLSVEAGMDFMTALQRNVERAQLTALDEELIRVIREIQLGKTRRQALRDMSRRVNLSELRAVVNALAQADELGVSIRAILRMQSDQIRQRRFQRAEKLANEAPVKMLGPLMFFIFPAVFLILLGPIVARLMEQGF